jgi:CheY-like chemotaxis protein
MPEGGRLRIELRNVDTRKEGGDLDISPGAYVCVRVVDNGAGMTGDVLERAFEPFFTTKKVGEGSGLGLSQVYGFVNQSGGDVKIASARGKGTTVAIYLPRCEEAADSAAHPKTAVGAQNPQGGETILVVEDDDAVREVAVEMIGDLGYRVLSASDGRKALALLDSREPIDLLFSDVSMPGGISGLTLAAKAQQRRREIKVVLTSGYPARDGTRLPEYTRFPMLQKPYQRDKLARVLRSVLDLGHETPAR